MERPDYWDGYHQAMLGHPLKPEGGEEYKRGHKEGLETFNRLLENKPVCDDDDLVADIEVFLWGGDFDDKQDAELERKHNKKPVAN